LNRDDEGRRTDNVKFYGKNRVPTLNLSGLRHELSDFSLDMEKDAFPIEE
jgi:hypothetical protein